MRLIDGDEGNVQAVEEFKKGGGFEPLRGDVEELESALTKSGADEPPLLGREGAVVGGGGDTEAAKGGDLVVHERDERGYDEGEPRQGHGGDLVTERLSAAGGHDPQAVAPLEYGGDEKHLALAERGVAKNGAVEFVNIQAVTPL